MTASRQVWEVCNIYRVTENRDSRDSVPARIETPGTHPAARVGTPGTHPQRASGLPELTPARAGWDLRNVSKCRVAPQRRTPQAPGSRRALGLPKQSPGTASSPGCPGCPPERRKLYSESFGGFIPTCGRASRLPGPAARPGTRLLGNLAKCREREREKGFAARTRDVGPSKKGR